VYHIALFGVKNSIIAMARAKRHYIPLPFCPVKKIPGLLTQIRYTCIIRVKSEEVFVMQKKLTVTIDEEVYNGLRAVIGPRKISRFIEELVRPHVVKKNMYAAYKEMAADQVRESKALEWAEGTFGDVNDEER
jgi:hypothetical protein